MHIFPNISFVGSKRPKLQLGEQTIINSLRIYRTEIMSVLGNSPRS